MPLHRTLAASFLVVLIAGCGHALPGTARPQAASAKLHARVVPNGYYQQAEGKAGAELLAALHDVVVPHTDLGYDRARDVMFGLVDDMDGDDVVSCIYIGAAFDHVTNSKTAYRNGDGLNAEHTWPQSKGAVGPAKADLHHLFPAQVHANTVRSAYPFGIVAQSEWEEGGSKLGLDANGKRVFEPRDDHKGDTARALLYFYACYGKVGSTDTSNFAVEAPVLAQWHQTDAVNDAERERNDAIYAAQGNRNPFVDRPEWVAAVGSFLPN